jgi:hypothetical protein
MFEAFALCVLAAFGGSCATFLIGSLLPDDAIERADRGGRFAGLGTMGAMQAQRTPTCVHGQAHAAARYRHKARRIPAALEA